MNMLSIVIHLLNDTECRCNVVKTILSSFQVTNPNIMDVIHVKGIMERIALESCNSRLFEVCMCAKNSISSSTRDLVLAREALRNFSFCKALERAIYQREHGVVAILFDIPQVWNYPELVRVVRACVESDNWEYAERLYKMFPQYLNYDLWSNCCIRGRNCIRRAKQITGWFPYDLFSRFAYLAASHGNLSCCKHLYWSLPHTYRSTIGEEILKCSIYGSTISCNIDLMDWASRKLLVDENGCKTQYDHMMRSACASGKCWIAKKLLEKSVLVNWSHLQLAICAAVKDGKTSLCSMLIKQGVPVTGQLLSSVVPFIENNEKSDHVGLVFGYLIRNMDPIHLLQGNMYRVFGMLASQGHHDVVLMSLEYGASPDVISTLAVKFGSKEVLEACIVASIFTGTRMNFSKLYALAYSYGHGKLCDWLMSNGYYDVHSE